MTEMSALEWQQAANTAADLGDPATVVYALRRSLALDDSEPALHQALITSLDMLPYASDATKRRARSAFDRQFVLPIMQSGAAVRSHGNDPDPERKLRVGYVSADLYASSAAFCHGSLIFGSDRQNVKIYVYASDSPRMKANDPVQPVFKASADVWRDVTALTNHEIASLVISDQIDILVDLGGYSSGSRMLVFAHRPAPIQITGWGHATGTGLSCFDYTVADMVTVPPEDEQRYLPEQILRVPSIIIYIPTHPGDDPTPHPITYQPSRTVTFGYLGRPEKIAPDCLAAWADIMNSVPGSRLILKSIAWQDEHRRARILIPLGAHGISSDRVTFYGETHNAQHLAVYNEIDVHLDSFYHSGGVSMGDACWMGCPTVTLLGNTISGRVGASILTTAGYGTRVARTIPEYVRIALGLTRIQQTPEYRQAARDMMARSVLVDQHRYATSVESGYREIWRRWCFDRGRPTGLDHERFSVATDALGMVTISPRHIQQRDCDPDMRQVGESAAPVAV